MPRIDASTLNLEETVVKIDRVAKVVKGGKRFKLRAMVVVGDKNGHVGMGIGKANEAPEAIRKATEDAKKHLITVPIVGTTIPFMVRTRFAASEVMLKPAAPGTGVIAGGAVRAVVEAVGIRDILTKSFGHSELNTVNATIAALKELRNPEIEAIRRNKSLTDMVGKRMAAQIAASTALAQAVQPELERERSERSSRRERSGGDRGDRRNRPPRGDRAAGPVRQGGAGTPPPVAQVSAPPAETMTPNTTESTQ